VRILTIVACLSVFLLMTAAGPGSAAEQTKDALDTVKKNIDGKKAVLVDVREKSEWDAGHVDGAIFLPLSELQKGVDKDKVAKQLPKDKIVYTHCVVGKRSVTAGNILEKLGYEVRPLKPGYKELLEAGFKKSSD
jgi:rhodanese-related sulfurtransferase